MAAKFLSPDEATIRGAESEQWELQLANADKDVPELERKIGALIDEFEAKHPGVYPSIRTRIPALSHKYDAARLGTVQIKAKLDPHNGDFVIQASVPDINGKFVTLDVAEGHRLFQREKYSQPISS